MAGNFCTETTQTVADCVSHVVCNEEMKNLAMNQEELKMTEPLNQRVQQTSVRKCKEDLKWHWSKCGKLRSRRVKFCSDQRAVKLECEE